MHELSLALEVCRLAQEQVGMDDVAHITTVALHVGDDAGVEVDNLQFCLEVLLREPPFSGATPILARCPGDTLRLDYLEVDDGRPND